ncbi:MAG: phosphotransferase [Duncaniella sp.]|uniref:RapZ C-terminal domain-containing protein n=1 Tax=Duncaniella sp. TaxID=2518496 RepID=UPI0023D14B5B|nr:RNase adapter RapZ [Duncaniella sp.]MDE6090994.1 phosphotransferase [Duncaniella sp.]
MLKDLYEKKFGVSPSEVERLTPAGSNRQYFRLKGCPTVVGVIGCSKEENDAFIYLARHFRSKGLPVPEVFAVSEDSLAYLQEDLGDRSLFDERSSIELLKKTISLLPDFQYAGAEGLDFSKCYPVSEFDNQAILWDLNYFKYCFLNTTGISYSEPRLEEDFRKMAVRLSANPSGSFMYRDFQSRNVMIKDGQPYFIDFQGGRRGPAEYDLVSFITQARAGFPVELREELTQTYICSASRYVDIDPEKFSLRLREFSLLRNLQVLGAYGFRGKFERKPHFLKSIPLAIGNLSTLIAEPFVEYPYLTEVLERMINKVDSELLLSATQRSESSLTVTVMSFSYKKGIPQDMSGNGGGFVFDCRGMENPGRYDEYKQITGLDRPVIDFLEGRGEIIRFLENCYGLVDPSVECYDRRGFTSLSVNFGCTGGQHRSVYGAQKMAEHIKAKYPHVKVHLIHREQNIDQSL